jgi:hypothetical protein
MKFRLICALAILGGTSLPALAHHGVAGVGAAGLEGPGAPVESASSAVLPEGKTLLYAKLDDARFKRLDPSVPEADYSQFWMAGIGRGVTPWLSAYLFAPYNIKRDTAGGYSTRGWADLSVMGQLGFKYDNGFRLVPANESLDDLEDWHFTVYAGTSLPTGNPNLKDANGNIDPGKSTGFGKSDWSLGLTATKMVTQKLTFNAELSTIRFRSYRYESDTTFPAGREARFGPEDRLNLAIAYRVYTNPERRLRADLSLEAQYLKIGRDWDAGSYSDATGGKIVYLLPGIRLYKDNMSFAFGIKKPAWTQLNESALQQGSEGKEKYRLIFSGSILF